MPWQLTQACVSSGLFIRCQLYHNSGQGWEAASGERAQGSESLNADTLASELINLKMLLLNEQHWKSLFSRNGAEDDFADFMAEACLEMPKDSFWTVMAVGSTNSILLLGSRHMETFSSRLMDACSNISNEQRKFCLRYLHARPVNRQKSQELQASISMAAEKQHAEWLSSFIVDVKPAVKTMAEPFGSLSAAGLADNCRSLFAALIASTGSAYLQSGGRLLLVYFGHTKNDPELLGMQLCKNFRKLTGQAETTDPALDSFNTMRCQGNDAARNLTLYLENL